MAWGHWYLRGVTLAALGAGIGALLAFDPSALQIFANKLFFFEKDPVFRLYETVGLLVGVGYFLSWAAARSITGEAIEAA